MFTSSLLKKSSSNRFVLLLATYYIAVFNIPFFEIVKKGIEKQGDINYFFIFSIPFFLIAALSIIFSILNIKHLGKPLFIILTMASSLVFYAALKYHIIFNVGMFENIFQTNNAEALTYINLSSIISFLFTGIIPCILIYKTKISYQPLYRELKSRLAFISLMLGVIVIIVLFFLQNYITFGRNNDEIKRYIIPTYFVSSLTKYVNVNFLSTPLEYHQLGTDAKLTTAIDKKPELLVLVVGETARAMNYQFYGYQRPTNQYTNKYNVVAFQDFTSCGTATAVSLPCMFSRLDRQHYDHPQAMAQDNLIDVIKHAGIDVYWFDNDSGCKGVCKHVKNLTLPHAKNLKDCDGRFCFDQVLINKLKDTLTEITHPTNTLIVLHIIGSHGPTYYLRYPMDKRPFLPDCRRSDIENCTHQELINSYDNTIAYTDYILSEVITELQSQDNRFNTGMIYLSDHGESLGENGMYLHGAPYSLAPKEQTHIPFLTWFSTGFLQSHRLELSCIKEKSQQGGYSQDNLFDTILGILNISTKVYQPSMDMLHSCRK